MIGLVSYNKVVLETGRGWSPYDQEKEIITFTVNFILFPINKSPSYRHIVNSSDEQSEKIYYRLSGHYRKPTID